MDRRKVETPPVLAGSLLLAHPSLQEVHFRRTVILLSSHDAEGAMGVVLNRPLGKQLGELSPNFALGPLAGVPLYQGGPVETRQVLLCAWRAHPDQAGYQLMFGLDPEKAAELWAEGGVHLRAFLGYAGWSAGQLEGELARNTWVVSSLLPNLLEQEADVSLWRDMLSEQGHFWKLLAGEPDDPSRN